MKASSTWILVCVALLLVAAGVYFFGNQLGPNHDAQLAALNQRFDRLEQKMDRPADAHGPPAADLAPDPLLPATLEVVPSQPPTPGIDPPTTDRSATNTIFYLRFAKADVAAKLVRESFAGSRDNAPPPTIVADERLNSLVVRGEQGQLAEVEALLLDIDHPFPPGGQSPATVPDPPAGRDNQSVDPTDTQPARVPDPPRP